MMAVVMWQNMMTKIMNSDHEDGSNNMPGNFGGKWSSVTYINDIGLMTNLKKEWVIQLLRS